MVLPFKPLFNESKILISIADRLLSGLHQRMISAFYTFLEDF